MRKIPIRSTLGKGFRWVTAPLLRHFTSPKYAGLFEYSGDDGGAYILRRSLYMPWELPNLLDREIVREGWQELQTLASLNETIHGLPGGFCRVMALELQWYMQPRLLRDADWAGRRTRLR